MKRSRNKEKSHCVNGPWDLAYPTFWQINQKKLSASYLASVTSFSEPRPDKKHRSVNFDSDLNERRHYDKDGYIEKMERRKQYER